MRFIDYTGQQIGHWLVLRRGEDNRFGHVRWLCRCRCGRENTIDRGDLTRARVIHGGGCKHCGPRLRRSPAPWLDDQGYMNRYVPEHPAASTSGCVKDHRLVMERVLGRYLRRHESVHHKNGARADNRPENLELWSQSHPAGQRVEDKLAWADWLLTEYAVTPVDTYLARARSCQ